MVTIYSTNTCAYCIMAKDYFKEKKVDKKHSTLCGFAICCAKGCPLFNKKQYSILFKEKKKLGVRKNGV